MKKIYALFFCSILMIAVATAAVIEMPVAPAIAHMGTMIIGGGGEACSGYTSMDSHGGASTTQYVGNSLYRATYVTAGSSYTLGKFTIELIEIGTAGGDSTLQLRDDNINSPGDLLEQWTVTQAEVADSATVITRTLVTPIEVTNAQKLWFVMVGAAGSDSSNLIATRYEVGAFKFMWSDDGEDFTISAWNKEATIELFRCD